MNSKDSFSFNIASLLNELKQMVHVFENLQKQATAKLPIAKEVSDLGDLIAVDGSLIDATFSMIWADYRKGIKKLKFTWVLISDVAFRRK